MKTRRLVLPVLLVVCVLVTYRPLRRIWVQTEYVAFYSCAGSVYTTLREAGSKELGLTNASHNEWQLVPAARVDRLLLERRNCLDCARQFKEERVRDPWGQPIAVYARITPPDSLDIAVVSPGGDGRFGTGDEIGSSSAPIELFSFPLPSESGKTR